MGWLVLGLPAALAVWAYEGSEDAVLYTTVYLIERSLSLDNLFVFLLLFAYFGVPYERRPRLLFWGIVAALALRGAFIIGGTALIEQFHLVIYILGVALLVLAYRIFRGVDDNVDPDKNLMVRLVRRFYPVTGEFREGHWFVKEKGQRYVTPLFLALVAIVFADIAFAIDSIPAAFAITHRPDADLDGQRVRAARPARALRARGEPDRALPLPGRDDRGGARAGRREAADRGHREDRPVPSLGMIAVAFAIGIGLSLRADSNDPDAERKREERMEHMKEDADSDPEEDGRALAALRKRAAAHDLPLERRRGAHPTARPPRPSRPRRRTSARAWGGRAPRGPRAGCPRGPRRPAAPGASAPPGG